MDRVREALGVVDGALLLSIMGQVKVGPLVVHTYSSTVGVGTDILRTPLTRNEVTWLTSVLTASDVGSALLSTGEWLVVERIGGYVEIASALQAPGTELWRGKVKKYQALKLAAWLARWLGRYPDLPT